ncbi:hypothetical protein GCM10009577_17930 [Streptomyces javensis]
MASGGAATERWSLAGRLRSGGLRQGGYGAVASGGAATERWPPAGRLWSGGYPVSPLRSGDPRKAAMERRPR